MIQLLLGLIAFLLAVISTGVGYMIHRFDGLEDWIRSEILEHEKRITAIEVLLPAIPRR